MSSTSSVASVDSASVSSEQECAPSPSAKSSRIAERYSRLGGRTFPAIQTSASSPQRNLPLTASVQTSSLAASLARTSLSLALWSALEELAADCGGNTGVSLESCDRPARSSRTSVPFAISDWTQFSGHSLRSGMTRNGTVYPLPSLAPLIDGTAYGLWPTPTARDWKGASDGQKLDFSRFPSFLHFTLRPPFRTSYPHPQFAERVMGYPPGWTEVAPSEIPSSRRLPKRSAAQS